MKSNVPIAGIFAIGDELTTGAVSDSNAAFLARGLHTRGVEVRRISMAPDRIDDIASELLHLAEFCDLIITSGGLGPTSDDLTRDAVAKVCGVELEYSKDAESRLKSKYDERNIPLNKASERQLYFPAGAAILPNPVGTADSFICELVTARHAVPIISLPGVPRELEAFFEKLVLPWLEERFPDTRPRPASHLHCFGLTESFVGQQVEECELPESIRVSYRAATPEIWVRLQNDSEGGDVELGHWREIVRNKLGEYVFSEEHLETMADAVGRILLSRSESIALAESCTGGMIASQLVNASGSSAYFFGSFVAYSNYVKEHGLGVDGEVIEKFGAVSAECAKQMAANARNRAKSTYGLSVTGIAGPEGGTPAKPVGTLWIGFADESGEFAIHHLLKQPRNRYRAYAAALALDVVRRKIAGLKLKLERR
jgi:nicotinamide-nucleotide amidase